MPETQLSWGGANPFASLTLDVTRLRAEGIPVYPQFMVPLRLAMATGSGGLTGLRLRVWDVSCWLAFENNRLSDHQGDVLDLQFYADNSAQELPLRFPFDISRLEHIERARIDDAAFVIRGKIVFEAMGDPEPPVTPPRPKASAASRLPGLFSVYFNLDFTVSRSDWTTSILPRLGWSAIHFIELPVPTISLWKETFATSLAELDEAQRHFKEGNYDQTVANCRAALEPFRKKAQDLKQVLKDARSSPDVAAKEFALLHEMATDTAEWLTGLLARHHTLASVAHHVPAIGHFSRDQAHALILLTTSLVMYTGDALSSQRNKHVS